MVVQIAHGLAVAPHEAREIEAIDDSADAPELSCPTTTSNLTARARLARGASILPSS